MDLNIKWKLLLFILLIAAITYRLGFLPLIFEEPRRSEVALEMIINDNYIVPTINDTYYYNKPPVYNWVMALFFKGFSSYEEWNVRIVTVLSFLAMALITFLITKSYVNDRAAWMAGFFVLTTADILFRYSLSGEIDVFYAFIVSLQIFSIFHFFKKGNYWLLFILSYFLCALGFLTKGLTSPAFQVLTLVGWGIGFGKFRKLFGIEHLTGIFVFVILVGAYFIGYSYYNDPWIFLMKLVSESSERTVAGGSFLIYLKEWAQFPFMFLSVTLPWCILFIFLGKRRFKELWELDLIKFALVFIAANILIYWLSPGTRPRYLYPFIPLTMIVAAVAADKYYSASGLSAFLEYLWGGVIVLAIAGLVTAPFFEVPEAIASPVVIAVLFTLILSGLFLAFYHFKQNRIWLFIASMIALRVLFNSVVLPVRKAEYMKANPYIQMTNHIIEVTGREKVWYYSPVEEVKIQASFFGIDLPPMPYRTIPWPSYQISYYLASQTGHILSWNDHRLKGQFYLTESMNVDETDVRIFGRYYIPSKGNEYILYKYKD